MLGLIVVNKTVKTSSRSFSGLPAAAARHRDHSANRTKHDAAGLHLLNRLHSQPLLEPKAPRVGRAKRGIGSRNEVIDQYRRWLGAWLRGSTLPKRLG